MSTRAVAQVPGFSGAPHNFYAALNAAVFTDGTFVYEPVDDFRVNASEHRAVRAHRSPRRAATSATWRVHGAA